MRPAEPATALLGGWAGQQLAYWPTGCKTKHHHLRIMDSLATLAVGEPDSDRSTDEPEDGGQEGKCLGGAPAVAGAANRDATPVKSAGIAGTVGKVDHGTKGGEPGDRQEDVDTPGDEAAAEGDQPDEAKQHGKTGNNQRVDEAGSGPGFIVSLGIMALGDAVRTSCPSRSYGECMRQ